MNLPVPPVLLITDRRQAARPLEAVVLAALQGGCRWVSLREKDLNADTRRDLLQRLRAVGQDFDATLTVHDDLEAARLVQGLHLPRSGNVAIARLGLGPEALLGQSAHDLAAARLAAAAGADYVTLSPIFPSLSKPGYGPVIGVEGMAQIVAELSIPVLALGGITGDRAASCRAAGAAGVAVMGAVMKASDPAREMRKIVSKFS